MQAPPAAATSDNAAASTVKPMGEAAFPPQPAVEPSPNPTSEAEAPSNTSGQPQLATAALSHQTKAQDAAADRHQSGAQETQHAAADCHQTEAQDAAAIGHQTEAEPAAAAAGGIRGFAARRPGWQLPQLHQGLQLADDAALFQQKGRQPCPKCQRSRYLYCYDCLVPLTVAPHVPLPFKFSIITHFEETASKNTGVHAAILCPGEIQLHDVDHLPAVDPARCVVLFPSDDALEVAQVEPDSIDRAIIIDSKWQKAKLLVQHPSFAGMRRVKLSDTRSSFWRFHTKGVADEGVCTIEAMYFFLKALAQQGKLTDPRFQNEHCFDNLLWYFVHQHKVLQQVAADKAAGQHSKAHSHQKGRKQQRQQQRQHGETQEQKQQQQQHQNQTQQEQRQQQQEPRRQHQNQPTQQEQQDPEQQEQGQHAKRPKLNSKSLNMDSC